MRALVLNDGQTSLAIITLDLVGFHLDTVDQIRTEVSSKTGCCQQLLLNTSAVFTMPVTISWGRKAQASRNYQWEALLACTIASSISQCLASLLPATLYAGSAPVRIGINRRRFAPVNINDADQRPLRHGLMCCESIIQMDRPWPSSLAMLLIP